MQTDELLVRMRDLADAIARTYDTPEKRTLAFVSCLRTFIEGRAAHDPTWLSTADALDQLITGQTPTGDIRWRVKVLPNNDLRYDPVDLEGHPVPDIAPILDTDERGIHLQNGRCFKTLKEARLASLEQRA